jgi:pyruvate dehydrogenase E1 component
MYEKQENIFYYIKMMNEFYKMPSMPQGVRDGILKGLYKFKASEKKDAKTKVNLLGSGAILNEAIKSQEILESKYDISADVWSVTSYKELYTDATQIDRWNMLHPTEEPKIPYIQKCFKDAGNIFVAASDYLKSLPCSVAKWIPGRLIALGTDGYGRSDSRAALRDYFEVDTKFITVAALQALAAEGVISSDTVKKAIEELEIDPEKISPLSV